MKSQSLQSKIQNLQSKIAALLVCLCFCISAGGQTKPALSQRRINEYAAALLSAERALLEAPRLRLPNEPLPAYCRRLVLPLPNEKEAERRARINGYFAALEKAANQTAEIRKAPPLLDAELENQKRWKLISASVSALPRCLQSLRADFQREKTAPNALPNELIQTLYAIHAAKEALRDARP